MTVVIPTFNERSSIEQVVAGVTAHGYRALVVDDASPDGTGAIVDDIASQNDLVEVLHRGSKQGLGAAYAEGFAQVLESSVEVVCEMDADLSHDPAALPDLVAKVLDGTDVAIGSRLVPGGEIVDWSAGRRLLSSWGNRYARILLGVPVRDMTSGYRAFRAGALRRLEAGSCRANGYAFQIEMVWRAHRAGMRIEETPITFTERASGESKLGMPIVLEAIWLVTRLGVGRLLGRHRRDPKTLRPN